MNAENSAISVAEFTALVDDQLPLMMYIGYRVERLRRDDVRIVVPFRAELTRPGGTVAGPVIMTLADLAMYAAVLTHIGRVELAVTTGLNCNFLRRPGATDLVAEARLLKLGQRLAVGDVSLYSAGTPDALVAHVTSTYSIPPPDKR